MKDICCNENANTGSGRYNLSGRESNQEHDLDLCQYKSTIPKGKTHGGLQVLTAYFVESGVVLGQKYVHEKTNEIPVFQEMLCYINIKGKIITADAKHCHAEHIRKIKNFQFLDFSKCSAKRPVK